MKLTLDSLGEAFRSYYDRLIAFLSIIALLVSLILLITQLGGIKADDRRFQDWEQGLSPAFAQATNVTLDIFDQAHNSLTNPFQISAWTKNLSIPELRIFCIDCARPVPFDATECPFCRAPIVRKITKDKDEDGMDDEWEVLYGLNPLDPGDARTDLDKDGFTNLEEYRADPKTKPNDPASAPPLIAKLQVKEIKVMTFHLKFMAVNKMTSGSIYQINSTKSGKTSWYKMGDMVEGYTIIDYKNIIVQESMGTGSMKRDVDKSTLTLEDKKTGRLITLVKGSADPISEFEVTFVFTIDGSSFPVKNGADFTLRGSVFTVKEIDNNKNLVLIREQSTGKETWISRQEDTP